MSSGTAAVACPPVRRGRHRLGALLLVVTLVLLCGACRVDLEVGIDAAADGSGKVRVEVVADRDAAAAVDLSSGLRADDLKQAGWTVEGPTRRLDGSVQVVATKPFGDVAGARRAVEEITGADGPFQGFRLERKRTFARTTTRFAGAVDFSRGVEAFGDAGVRKALGGSDIGIDLSRFEQTLGSPVNHAVGVRVAVRLPGGVTSNASNQTGQEASWQLHLPERADLRAQSVAWNTSNLVGVVVTFLAVLGLVILLVSGRQRRHSP